MASTVEKQYDYLFKNNSSFLNQTNWMDYFSTCTPTGFYGHPAVSTDEINLSPRTTRFMINGLKSRILTDTAISGPSSTEYDCLFILGIGNEYTPEAVKLHRITNITSTEAGYKLFLARMMHALSYHDLQNTLDAVLSYYNINVGYCLPVAYAVYNKNYWDLSKCLNIPGNYYTGADYYGAGTTDQLPHLGIPFSRGCAQIFGGHKIDIRLTSGYSLNDWILYPVPICNMEPSTFLLRNSCGHTVTVKIPTTYNDMEFEYFLDSGWTAGTNLYSIDVPDDGKVLISFSQLRQKSPNIDSISVPTSVYQISHQFKS